MENGDPLARKKPRPSALGALQPESSVSDIPSSTHSTHSSPHPGQTDATDGSLTGRQSNATVEVLSDSSTDTDDSDNPEVEDDDTELSK